MHMVIRILDNHFFKIVSGEDNGKQAECYSTDDEKCQWIDKAEKVLVISLPNTIIHPRTVVIKVLKGNDKIHHKHE